MIRLLSATIMISLAAHGWAQSSVNASVAAHRDSIIATADALWNFAELGYLEAESSATLQGVLETAGFSITRGVANIPTAFTASYGSGSPVIAILGEFDALPGISQAAVPYPSPIEGKTSGQACGHNLFGAGSMGAALAVKD